MDQLAAELEDAQCDLSGLGEPFLPANAGGGFAAIAQKERRLRYIRGKKARRAISAEIRELKESLARLAERDCSPAEQARCEKRAKTYERLHKERLSLEEQMRNLKVAGRFEADLEAKAAILEDLDYLDADGNLLPRGNLPCRSTPRNC